MLRMAASNSISSSSCARFHKTSCVQPSLETATDSITEWLNVWSLHRQKTDGTDVTPSDSDGNVHLIILRVLWGVTVKIFPTLKKIKSHSEGFQTTSCFGTFLSSCFDILTSFYAEIRLLNITSCSLKARWTKLKLYVSRFFKMLRVKFCLFLTTYCRAII